MVMGTCWLLHDEKSDVGRETVGVGEREADY